jgi:hypothetical protein
VIENFLEIDYRSNIYIRTTKRLFLHDCRHYTLKNNPRCGDIHPRPVELPATDPNSEVDFEAWVLSTSFPNPVSVDSPAIDPNPGVGFGVPALSTGFPNPANSEVGFEAAALPKGVPNPELVDIPAPGPNGDADFAAALGDLGGVTGALRIVWLAARGVRLTILNRDTRSSTVITKS